MNEFSNSRIALGLYLADTALILGHRNSEWCGHGPILEQDIAITNISLDLIGQARNFYQYTAGLVNKAGNIPSTSRFPRNGKDEVTEDTLAYLRDVREFQNVLLAELPNGDWGQTILRQFFISAYQYLLYQQLQQSAEEHLAAIAAKSLKEVSYHLRWSSEWVIRLGDGTDESHERMSKAIEQTWPYTGELFMAADYETEAGLDVAEIGKQWMRKVDAVFGEATLSVPATATYMHSGGKNGTHTEHLGYILAEMQFLQRAYPNNEW